MQKFFLKHCSLYRLIIKKLFGKPKGSDFLHIPWEIYGDFDVHYLGYDENGYVKKGLLSMAAASGFAMMVNAMRRKDAEQGVQLTRTVGLGRYISTKLALGLVIPVLHKVMVGPSTPESDTQPTKKKRGLLRRLFFSKTR